MVLLYLTTFLLLMVAIAHIRKTYYFMSVLVDKKIPLWVRLSGKLVRFIESLVSLQIFDKNERIRSIKS